MAPTSGAPCTAWPRPTTCSSSAAARRRPAPPAAGCRAAATGRPRATTGSAPTSCSRPTSCWPTAPSSPPTTASARTCSAPCAAAASASASSSAPASKAYPNVHVTHHKLEFAPRRKTANNSDLLEAVSYMVQAYPALVDGGFAGYITWFRELPVKFIGNATSGYTHSLWTIGKTKHEAEAVFAPVRRGLARFEDRLDVGPGTYTEYGDYWSLYEAQLDRADIPGDTLLLTSRMLEARSVADYGRVRNMVEVVSGQPDEYTMNLMMLVSGGQVFAEATDATSGVLPAWRTSPMVLISGRRVARTATLAERQAIADVTFVKGAATKKLAPTTGGYINEGDANDPDYIQTFYGSEYPGHLASKRKYDPDGIFYCRTCVGAEEYIDQPDGPLCRI